MKFNAQHPLSHDNVVYTYHVPLYTHGIFLLYSGERGQLTMGWTFIAIDVSRVDKKVEPT